MSKEKDTQQMSLLEDSPANHSALQEKENQQQMIVTSGMKCLESLEKQNQDGLLEKMLKALLISTKAWYSDRCLMTWKTKVSKANVLLFQLQASVHGIKENESGLWLTPTATDIATRSEEALQKRKDYRSQIGRKTVPPGNLSEQVMYGKPTTNMYPTPTRGMYKQDVKDNGEYARSIKEKGHQIMLPAFMKLYPTPTQDSASERTKKYSQGGTPLTMAVKMFPTPTASDMEGGAAKDVQIENGHFFRENKKGVRWGVKLRDAMEMMPTPTARDYKDAAYNPTWKESRDKSLPRTVLKNNKHGGKLNPNFVEFLMGYPMNWTKIDPTE
jgi:hypothetical protein